MDVYLAIIQPDHEGATVMGVFSTLELAKLAFSDQDHEWIFSEQYKEWWQVHRAVQPGQPLNFGNNMIKLLTLDQVVS
jgi:hypothetical protein